jgi:type III secretion protein U
MSSDKTEEPTDQKLRKAREKGQVAKSQDLSHAVSMLGVMVALLLTADDAFTRIRRLLGQATNFGDGDLPLSELYQRMGAMALEMGFIVFPLILVAAAFSVVGVMSQIGVLVSMEAVAPKVENLNPAAGIKKMVSAKSLMMLGQMFVKAVVLGVVLWKVVLVLLPLVTGAVYQSVPAIGSIAWVAVSKVLCIGLLLFLLLGPLDLAIQRWQFMKGQRMSKDDIKREYKDAEGDPHMKHQRERLAQEIANGPDRKQAVASASAVIVNPTHYAVAIRYDPQVSALPIIVAKGFDDEAMLIRGYAESAGVPIFGNPPLARALFKVPLSAPVPEELFGAVAAVLRWVGEIGPAPAQRPH